MFETRSPALALQHSLRASSAADGEEDEALLDSAAVTRWLRDAESRRVEPRRPDSPEALRARLDLTAARRGRTARR